MRKLFTPLFLLIFCRLSAAQDTVLVKMCYYTTSMNYDERTFNVYDSIGQMNGSYSEFYSGSSQQWFKGIQYKNYYNTNGDTFLIVTQGGNLGNQWYDMSSTYFVYDSSGNIITNYYISCSSETCDTLNRIEFTYNGSHQRISATTLLYFQNVWAHSDSVRYYYIGNLIDSSAVFQFDSAGWHHRSYTKYFRDQFSRDSIRLIMRYSFQTLTFDSADRTIYTYDSIHRKNTIVSQEYFISQWDCPYQNEYDEYDFLGRYTHLYNTCCGCGFSENYYYYISNTDSLFAEMYCRISHGGSGHCDTCVYINQPFTTNVFYNIGSDLSIYPNPTSEFLNVSFTKPSNSLEVFVFDLTGRLVLILTDNNKQNRFLKLDLSSLKNGIFFLNILTDGEKITRRVVKL